MAITLLGLFTFPVLIKTTKICKYDLLLCESISSMIRFLSDLFSKNLVKFESISCRIGGSYHRRKLYPQNGKKEIFFRKKKVELLLAHFLFYFFAPKMKLQKRRLNRASQHNICKILHQAQEGSYYNSTPSSSDKPSFTT